MAAETKPEPAPTFNFLSPADLLRNGTASDRFAPVPLGLPELGGSVFIRKLRAGEYNAYQIALEKCPNEEAYAFLVAHAVGDVYGARVFLDKDIGDLKQFDAAVAATIVAKFRELNGQRPKA